MKQIEIIIDAKGQSQVKTTGFVGPACRQASRFLERALGRKSHERLTAEFHQTQSTEEQQHERG